MLALYAIWSCKKSCTFAKNTQILDVFGVHIRAGVAHNLEL